MVPTFTTKPSTNFFNNLLHRLPVLFVFLIAAASVSKAQIAAWDFTGVVSTAPQASFAATTFNANLVSTSGANLVTRGATAGPSNGGNSFRTTGFKNDGVATTNTDFFQITLSASTGYQLSLGTIDAKFRGTSSFCAAPGVTHMFAYSLDGVTFTSTGTQVTIGGSGTAGISIAQVDLSVIPALQNVPTGTTVYIRYYATGQTTTGGWGFYSNVPGSNGLAIGGSVTLASTNTITTGAVASAPFSLANCAATAAGTVAFTSVGPFVGNTYTAQLSDAAGTFATPLNIGTLVSNANAGSVNITIPAGSLSSALYRIRVISSGPSVVGGSSAAFTITQLGSCATTATDYFQSNVITGNFGTAASWQSSLDNGVTDPWITATLAPTAAATRITVRSGHNITVAASVTADDIVVAAGGTLTVAAGQTLTVANGAAAIDMDVFGSVVCAGVVTSTGNSTFEASSVYQHTANAAGNAIITATWNATSTCAVSGMTGTGPTTASIGQTFGNFIWGCIGQTTPYSINTSSFTTQGKFTVDTTGVSPANYLSITGGVGTTNTNTFGSLDVNGGILNIVSNTSAGTLTNTTVVNGDVTVTGGVLSLAAGTSDGALGAKTEVGILRIGGNLSVANPGNFWSSNTSVNHYTLGRVDFIKAGTQTVNFTNVGGTFGFVNYYINSGSTLQVLPGGLPLRSTSTTEFDALTVNGGATIDFGLTGTVYQSSGTNANFITTNLSTVITSNADGLMGGGNVADVLPTTGSIRVGTTTTAGSRVFAAGTSYVFNGATTTAFPRLALQTLFGNPLNVTLGANISTNRAITITNTLALGANVLTQGGFNLGFSGVTGAGSVSPDNACGITITGVTAALPGTLRLSGTQTTAQINMNRAGTLTLGSDVIFDANNAAFTGNNLLLTSGIVDASGRSLSFMNLGGEAPITRTAGSLTVSTSTNLTFGLPGFIAGNTFSIPASTFTSNPSINNLTINRTNAINLTLWSTAGAQPLTINGTLTLTAGTFNNNGNALTFQNGNTPIVRVAGFLTMGANASLTFGTAGNTGGAAFTIPSPAFTSTPTLNGFSMNRANTLTLGSQGFTINAPYALTIVSGTLNALALTLDGTGDVTMTGGVLKLGKNATTLPELTGTYTLTGGGIEFSGNGVGANAQTIKALSYNDLTFSGGGDRILPSSGTVGIKGTLTPSTNVTTITGSLVDFNGTNQTVPAFTTAASAPYVKQFNSVKFSGSGSKTLADNFTMLDSLKIYTGVTLAVGNNAVTLKSGLTQTARVAAVEGTGTITYGGSGKFIVERFIQGHRAWRLMGAPLQAGEQTINAAWQEGAASTSSDPNPGYGTHISGGAGKTEAMGYDLGPNKSSVYGYNSGTDTWNVIPATTNAVDINLQPLMLFVRGSRGINLPASTPATIADNTVLRPSGKINLSGNYSFSATAGFAACINPVAAPINFHSLSKTNIVGGIGGDAYYMWDPNLTGSNAVGAWVSFSWNGTSYDQNIASNITTTGVIPSGAAFMVSQSGSGTLAIAQKDVTTDAGGQPYVFRPVSGRSNLRTSLFAVNADGTKSLNDGALVVFANGYSNAVNNEDMIKLDNFSENISMSHNGKRIAIERRAPVSVRDTIFFSISKMKQKNYELQIEADRFLHNAAVKAYLKDGFTGTETVISTNVPTRYNFTVTADAASYDAGRFRIVFKRSGLPTVSFSSIRGYKQNSDIALEWKSINELDLAGYEIEKSADGGQSFSKASGTIIPAKLNNEGLQVYNWLDINPAAGENIYRVKGIGVNGTSDYSDLVKVSMTNGKPAIAIYPNPIVNNTIGLQMERMPAGNYSVKLLSQDGQVVYSSTLSHNASTGAEQLSLNKTVPAGIYQLKIVKPGGEIIILKLMK